MVHQLNHLKKCVCLAGKAGGFLALDWSDGTKLSPLARASYKLHGELAEKFGKERIDYRPVHTLMVSVLKHLLLFAV